LKGRSAEGKAGKAQVGRGRGGEQCWVRGCQWALALGVFAECV
jgi:hypothetical protein